MSRDYVIKYILTAIIIGLALLVYLFLMFGLGVVVLNVNK